MTTISIGPRDFIGPPFSRCESCRTDDLGVLSVGPKHVTRRCRKCLVAQQEALPALDKKVVYLDQFVISNILKVLDATARGHERAMQNPAWLEIYKLLDVLVRGQIVACPNFENHRTESMYSPFYPSLKWLYDCLSGGARIRGSEEIKRGQLAEALTAWLEGREAIFDMNRQRMIGGKLNVWLDRIRFVIKGHYPDDLDEMRKLREQGHEQLTATFERWRTEKGGKFEDWFLEELRAFGEAYLYVNQEWVKGFVRVNLGLEPFSLKAAWPPDAVSTISVLAGLLRYQHGLSEADARSKVVEFLKSDAPMAIPYLRISAALWATMAMKAAAGQKAPPNQGTFADVNAVATVLPICDAMFIDDKCAATLRDIPKSHRPPYNTRVFSTQSTADFIAYLKDLLAAMTDAHKRVLASVYGDTWDQTNLKLFENRT